MKQINCSWAPLSWHHLRQTHTHTPAQINIDQSLAFSFLLPNWCHSCCRFSAAFCVFFQPSSFILMFLSLRIAFYQLPCSGRLAVANLSVWIKTKIYNTPVWPVHIICVLSEAFLMWTVVSLCPSVFTKPICIHDYFPCFAPWAIRSLCSCVCQQRRQ